MLGETPPLLLAATLLLAVMAALVTGQADCDCGPVKDGSGSQRIVGGEEAGENDYPWMVRLVGTTPLPGGCGGSIISRRHVLTVAHCIHPYSAEQFSNYSRIPGQGVINTRDEVIENLKVVVGEHSMQKYIDDEKNNIDWKTKYPESVYSIEKITWHKDWWPNGWPQPFGNNIYDYGIITLKDPVTFSDKVKPICFPVDTNIAKYENKKATIAGWGQDDYDIQNNGTIPFQARAETQSTVLKKLEVTLTPNQNTSRYIYQDFGLSPNSRHPITNCFTFTLAFPGHTIVLGYWVYCYAVTALFLAAKAAL